LVERFIRKTYLCLDMTDEEITVNPLRILDFLASLPVNLFALVMFVGFAFASGETAYPRIMYLMISVLMGYVSLRLMWPGVIDREKN